jgi:hypothetical protein
MLRGMQRDVEAQKGPRSPAAAAAMRIFSALMACKPLRVEVAEAALKEQLLEAAALCGAQCAERDVPDVQAMLLSLGLLTWRRGEGTHVLRLSLPGAGTVVRSCTRCPSM